MTSGRKSIDEVYQRDKFWNLMEVEGIVNKTKSINGQNMSMSRRKWFEHAAIMSLPSMHGKNM